jgi:pimeloyl-ACP methyl ester carboxylesterase
MSKPNLYALHVGINRYPDGSRVSSLAGCVNDAKMLGDFIQKQFGEEYRIHAKTLLDQEATYAAIVEHFGAAHLGKAGSGDIVFFSYSGHGAKERSAPEFKDPGGMGETLVCYDSRTTGKDLADKELAVLAHRLEQQGAYVVTLLDCCHSGSGFRGDVAVLGKARQCDDRSDLRPLDAYLDGHYTRLRDQGAPLTVPNPKQLNLAACDRSEKAYEHGVNGLFTHCLLQVLNNSPRISYAKLFDRTRAKMRAIADRQTPRFEPSNAFDSHELFLRPGNTAEEIRNTLFFKSNVWKVNLGNLHGIPVSAAQPAEFAVYKKGESSPFTHVKARSVGFQDTTVDFQGDPGEEYDARLISLPEAGIPVTASAAFLEKLETLQKDHPTLKSVFASLSTDTDGADYKLEYAPEQISILRKHGELVKGYAIKSPEEEYPQFRNALDDLDHVAKWERFVALEKSSAALRSDKANFELRFNKEDGTAVSACGACAIEMYKKDGKYAHLPFSLHVQNPSNQELYCAIFYLPNDYSVQTLTQTEVLPAGSEKKLYAGDFELGSEEPEELFHVKVVLSTEYINSYELAQDLLENIGEVCSLKITKDLGSRFRGGISRRADDWFTQTITIRLVGIEQKISDQQAVTLADGAIKIRPNETLRAQVCAEYVSPETARSGDILGVLPRLLDPEIAALISNTAGGSRSSAQPLVLILTDLAGSEQITAHPLELEVSTSLEPHERLLPITYDGEKIVLLGYSDTQPDGSILVTVNQLPDQQPPAGTRSIGKALWFYLVKIAGIDKPELRCASRAGDKIKRSTTGLITKVAGAQRILLVVHGIIGDTRDMARFGLEAADAGRFDLVLTFDYENLNTPIDQTAAILRDELAQAGLAPGHGKELTILAHSMGGLVSRWYIENLGGNKVVSHLVMAGTPNLGSNFGKVTEYIAWGGKLLGLAGALKLSIPYTAPILGFLGGLQALTKTLAQMNYDDAAGFLKSLEKNPDPGIPYAIVAGSLDGYLAAEQDPALSDKVLDAIANVFNGQADNDIAVEVSSITGVSNARQPAPQCQVVPCHHMNYFVHPESVAVLQRYLGVETV